MTISIAIVLGIIVLAIVLFATEKISADTTALLVMVLLMLTGILTPEEALSGFAHEGTISVMALLILSLGLQSTGGVIYVGRYIEKIVGRNEIRMILMLSLVVAFASAFISNTAVVAILLPVTQQLAKFANVSVSRLLMPLSFSAMIGGSMTIIGTSTNIIVSSIYEEQFGRAFGIYEFSKLGFCLLIAYLIFMLLIGRLILPKHKKESELTKDYELDQYLTQVKVLKKSPLIGKQIVGSKLIERHRIRVIEIARGDEIVFLPEEVEKVHEGDLLLIKTNVERLFQIRERLGLKVNKDRTLDDEEMTSEDAILIEAVIGLNSFLVGKKVRDVDFREEFNAIPLAVRRSGVAVPKRVADIEIKFGDVWLFEARRNKMDKFYNSPDFIVMSKLKKTNLRKRKTLLSTMIVIGSIAAASLNLLPLVVAALTGCILLFLTRCVSMRYIYRKLDWRIFFLLAGVLPLGIAIEKTGTSEWIANGMVSIGAGMTAPAFISLLFLLTTILTSFMSNNATAIILAPIAINIASQLGVDPKPFLVAVMFAASTSFLSPLGYQTNMLIYGAGKYKFSDFLKVGGLLTLVIWILASFLIPYFYL